MGSNAAKRVLVASVHACSAHAEGPHHASYGGSQRRGRVNYARVWNSRQPKQQLQT
jgi:hypothetical protein